MGTHYDPVSIDQIILIAPCNEMSCYVCRHCNSEGDCSIPGRDPDTLVVRSRPIRMVGAKAAFLKNRPRTLNVEATMKKGMTDCGPCCGIIPAPVKKPAKIKKPKTKKA